VCICKQHFHHLLDARPHSPTQNIAIAEGPGVEGLPKLMDALLADPVWAESIANNSYPLFRHYLSPAGVHCYWRQFVFLSLSLNFPPPSLAYTHPFG
jgi:hypothetical protein